LQVVIKTSKAMQYHFIVMELAEYSSSYSLFASHMMLVWPCSNSATFQPLRSSLMLSPQCPAFN